MTRVLIAAVLIACVVQAFAMWMTPVPTPIDRIAENLNARLKEDPNDAPTWYSLGRVHSLAFSTGMDEVGTVRTRDDPEYVPSDESNPSPGPGGSRTRWIPEEERVQHQLAEDVRIGHLEEAIRCFERAMEIGLEDPSTYDGTPALHLSYAYVLEHGAKYASQVECIPGVRVQEVPAGEQRKELETKLDGVLGAKSIIEDRVAAVLANEQAIALLHEWSRMEDERARRASLLLASWWTERAADAYLKSFDAALKQDMEQEFRLAGYTGLVSYEAGSAYLRLIEARGVRKQDEAARERVEKGLTSLKERRRASAITPIIFSLEDDRPMRELLASDVVVDFDLAATGMGERWPWVRSDTAILCWDPFATGRIRDGRQLFGSATWWLMFEDGYRALDALDDDRDGELTGGEFAGIAVWLDANSNGVSDPGEVRPVGEHGIVAIATRADSSEDGCPASHVGVRFADERTLPTYDWIAECLSVPGGSTR